MGSGEREPSTSVRDGGGSGDDAGTDTGGSRPSRSKDPRELAAFVLVALAIVGAAAIVVGPAGDTTTTDTGAGGAAGTATPESVATTATATTTTTADSAPDVAMRVRSIETCGTRCRTVTIGLTNRGDDPAQSVRVATEITTGGSLVWEGRSDVGSLAAGETVTRTRTIRIGYVDAARIERNDGRIRIETTVRTASGTRTFTERRTVS
ncbi:hypothetical protein [Haloplanus litoreus]|uniref:Flagellin N-terminal-like domain-containing protein n=1 Tax=Haloplanus litoreus TaxID=767515 RepID=A0ABD5ZWA9_9EURY